MKAKVIRKGVHDQDGKPVQIGTEIEFNGDVLPGYLVGKAVSVDAVAIPNPKQSLYSIEKNGAWCVVKKDGSPVTKSLRSSELEEFESMSEKDKAAFVELHKAD